MDNATFVMSFQSDIVKVKNVLTKDLLVFLKQSLPNMSSQDAFELRLIFSELLNNAVVHGNKNDQTKWVHLNVEIRANYVVAAINDEGTGFDYETHLSSLEGYDEQIDIYDEHGRGIKIAMSLTDEIRFYDSGRRIEFSKKVESIS